MTERAAYRVNEFAKAIGVHRITVWRWIKAGDIPIIRLGQTTLIPAYVLTNESARHTAQPDDPVSYLWPKNMQRPPRKL